MSKASGLEDILSTPVKTPPALDYSGYRCRSDAFSVRVGEHFCIATVTADGDALVLQIHSSLGVYAHRWDKMRKFRMARYLARCDYVHVMGAIRKGLGEGFELDGAAAARLLREETLRLRGQRMLTPEEARDVWSAISDLEECSSESEFRAMAADTQIVGLLYGGDAEQLPLPVRRSSQCEAFWTLLWPPLLVEMQRQYR